MPVERPAIVWKGDATAEGSIKYGYPPMTKGRNGQRVIAIVDHIMEGTLSGTDTHFRHVDASTHFGVGKNGVIWQWVDLGDAAWGNVDVKNPSWSLLPQGVSPNLVTVSIEHEGFTGQALTPAQKKASFQMQAWLCQELQIKPSPETVIGHYRINSVTRAQCPGAAYPWDELFAYLNEALREVPPYMVDFNKKLKELGLLETLRDPLAEPQWWEIGAVVSRLNDRFERRLAEEIEKLKRGHG